MTKYTVMILKKDKLWPNVWTGTTDLNQEGLKDLIEIIEKGGVESIMSQEEKREFERKGSTEDTELTIERVTDDE